MDTAYFWFKALHIVGFTVWLAGLFYLPRLFVYHVEAEEQPEPIRTALKNQFALMERRLYNIITTPGMVLTIAMAVGILTTEPEVLQETWLHVKLGLVALLIGYHYFCSRIRKQLAAGTFTWSGQQLRAYNEVSTVLFILIVMLAIFKDQFPTNIATWFIVGLVVLMAVAIQLYARKRRLDKEKLLARTAQE
ncbi:protoporphyrinogen oxidase HemJ [Candidatus Cyanaurora vandensis]|uniref:protoporphyrinogen oxidase HemJ n=1 Tax=Candidatus Cyanaurora vandensis TaxID=2714958 RepID=UPI00257ED8E1|nr:protoporphyrinogen oxidase HemJ [Candidatus Cyanaurora vandensis]